MTTETSGDPRVAAGSAADWWEAGFEMGRLDQQLAARLLPDRVGLTIRRVNRGGWAWECSCGGSSPRARTESTSWAAIVIDALRHSQLIAP